MILKTNLESKPTAPAIKYHKTDTLQKGCQAVISTIKKDNSLHIYLLKCLVYNKVLELLYILVPWVAFGIEMCFFPTIVIGTRQYLRFAINILTNDSFELLGICLLRL